jgi:GNAT superfamily N-acetyltransferase
MKTTVTYAKTDVEIQSCFELMHELRPHLKKDCFVERVKRQMRKGYLLAFLRVQDTVVSLAGYRVMENLAHGRFLYVDDLVTVKDERGKGYASTVMDFVYTEAQKQHCDEVHLDSGFQREAAHRFYKRRRMEQIGIHFRKHMDKK